MYSKTALILSTIATAALVNAQTADQLAELNVIVDDVKNHMSDYLGLVSSGAVSISDLPAGVMNLALAVQTATDDSYTSLYKDVDVEKLGPFLTALPWYSSRLAAELETATEGDAAATSSAAAATSSAAAVTSSSAAAVTSSSAAAVTSASSEVSTSSPATISSVNTASSTAAVTEQTVNNAAKAAGSFGVVALGAAALLL
ncbi:similar to Saccharomyces cerevisiae YER011W TIR1 Cell wall mannoprotein of the Srp1p/Tip1p family of serine-alanine-rich proteins [Maudiozyma saulgeensis]|uniref:Similar to Saccharomyces cerevisiae YER011W TIR1 Cell wall mannoprotein of the Srp1p/Tip1p family of serine-alanine-rich proteins n=1 Tax=Maudiozyma saulgeensis TaxID=1789683 RepID=A0A1X7R7E0_9SACH|nr:similar to Saccharomyces cerevisiae YER011W TIR1 Cell wall mannoprotein of the Srp1p/Tip1p family of serine-alanine-rich proteins [Kazachstania saulgeensis]